jgi:hypothetical protein
MADSRRQDTATAAPRAEQHFRLPEHSAPLGVPLHKHHLRLSRRDCHDAARWSIIHAPRAHRCEPRAKIVEQHATAPLHVYGGEGRARLRAGKGQASDMAASLELIQGHASVAARVNLVISVPQEVEVVDKLHQHLQLTLRQPAIHRVGRTEAAHQCRSHVYLPLAQLLKQILDLLQRQHGVAARPAGGPAVGALHLVHLDPTWRAQQDGRQGAEPVAVAGTWGRHPPHVAVLDGTAPGLGAIGDQRLLRGITG